MAVDGVRGAEDFYALSKRMKAAGQTELRKELNKALKAAAKPVIPKVKAATSRLPQGGGLARRVAKKSYRVQVRTGAATAGVRIAASGLDPRIDEGRVSHPVFGRKPNVVQRVQPGFFSETIQNDAESIRRDAIDVLQDFVKRVVG